MRYYKYYKQPVEGTRVEVTRDYFTDNDEYINEENGWIKIHEHYIDIEGEENEESWETYYSPWRHF